jgi:molybdopterin molybdotransferase
MIPLGEAQQIIEEALRQRDLGSEQLPVREAAGRVLLAPARSGFDIPPFDRVTMDGYAVAAGESASRLRVLAEVQAGELTEVTVRPGTAVKVMTGAPAPPGTNRVIMLEKTRAADDFVELLDPEALSTDAPRHVAPRGEDLRAGEEVMAAGQRIDPVSLAGLIACGVETVTVSRQPRLVVLATGNELVETVADRNDSKILNSNSPLLYELLRRYGYPGTVFPAVPDELEATRDSLAAALAAADVVVLTGGVSAGDYDYVPDALRALGLEILVSRVAVKPGKPVTFARGEKGVVFGLPGNPVSAFVTCHLFVLPALAQLEGTRRVGRFVTLPLGENLTVVASPRLKLIPARLTDEGSVIALPYHGSGHLHALMAAQGLIRIEPGTSQVSAGTPVPFWPLSLGAFREGMSP